MTEITQTVLSCPERLRVSTSGLSAGTTELHVDVCMLQTPYIRRIVRRWLTAHGISWAHAVAHRKRWITQHLPKAKSLLTDCRGSSRRRTFGSAERRRSQCHRDVPPVTSSQKFLNDLATHLHITIPFDLKEHFSFTQLLVRTAQQTHQSVPPAAQDDLGEGVVLGPCATALGFTTGLWLAAARAERVVRGAVDDPTVRDWLTAVNEGSPRTRSSCARRSVSRSRKVWAAL